MKHVFPRFRRPVAHKAVVLPFTFSNLLFRDEFSNSFLFLCLSDVKAEFSKFCRCSLTFCTSPSLVSFTTKSSQR